MIQTSDQEKRKELLELQINKEQNVIKAQEIVLKHLDDAIQSGNPATVAAMAEILKI